MEKLIQRWNQFRISDFTNRLITYLRLFPERIYTSEKIDSKFQRRMKPIFKRMFTPLITPSDGDCFFHCISLSLTGNTQLSYAIRLAVVSQIIEHHQLLESRICSSINDARPTLTIREYKRILVDSAFSAGICQTLETDDDELILDFIADHLIDAKLKPEVLLISTGELKYKCTSLR